MHVGAWVCRCCGRNQRLFLRWPSFWLAFVGAAAAIVAVVSYGERLLPKPPRLEYTLESLGTGTLFFDGFAPFESGWRRLLDRGFVPFHPFNLDSADLATLRVAMDSAAATVEAVHVCVVNRSKQKSDSLHVFLERDGWFIGGTFEESPLGLSGHYEPILVGQRLQGGTWELRRDGLAEGRWISAILLWARPVYPEGRINWDAWPDSPGGQVSARSQLAIGNYSWVADGTGAGARSASQNPRAKTICPEAINYLAELPPLDEESVLIVDSIIKHLEEEG